MSGRRQRLVRVIVVAALALWTTVALATPVLRLGPAPVSSTVYPDQEILLDFDHAGHLERGLVCGSCHRLAKSSRSPTDNLLPQEAACAGCHAKNTRARGQGPSKVEAKCRTCHPGAEGRVNRSLIPTSNLRFSHQDHDGETCDRCHTRVPVRTLATADDLPDMRLCLGCHDGREGRGRRCETCHLTEPDGSLRTQFDSAQLTPPGWMYGAEHDPLWTSSHGDVATERISLCSACHQQHECLACHDGNVRPRDVHPGDWLSSHALEARAGDLRCRSCHRGQSFCRTCHLRAGVAWRSPVGRTETTGNVVHRAPNWASPTAPLHGREARRALQTCVSCHAGEDCVTCHALVNPHPPGFSNRCRSLVRAGSQACIACHSTPEGLCTGVR